MRRRKIRHQIAPERHQSDSQYSIQLFSVKPPQTRSCLLWEHSSAPSLLSHPGRWRSRHKIFLLWPKVVNFTNLSCEIGLPASTASDSKNPAASGSLPPSHYPDPSIWPACLRSFYQHPSLIVVFSFLPEKKPISEPFLITEKSRIIPAILGRSLLLSYWWSKSMFWTWGTCIA